jgi:RimJ/RimL family protein N-acetyltransferase
MGRFRDVELDDVELADERVVLRRWRPDDAERVFEVMRDPSMRQFLALPDPYTREVADRWVTELGHEGRGEGTGLGCAMAERASGRLVGAAALRLGGDPEIGYWVAPDARGHGYAARASTLLTDWAFSLGLRRVRLACDVRNLASVRTALAAGFQFEGVARDGVASAAVEGVPPLVADLARFARLPDDPPGPLPLAFPVLPPDALSDGVLQLRTTREDDATALWETDDAVAQSWSFTGEPEMLDRVRRTAARAGLDWLVGGIARLSMVDVASGRVAGAVQLRKAGPPQVGGIGYGVHPDFRGRGYTARALRLLSPWAFDTADFARLELGAKAANEASLRAAAAAGFEPDGVRKRRLRNPDGSFSDEVRYALINPKYA